MLALGLDIGGTRVKAAWVGAGAPGRATGKSGRYARPDRRRLVEALRSAMPPAGRGPDAVGICCPGLADAEGRVVESVNVPGLCADGGSLRDLVAEAVGGDLAPARATDAHATAVDAADRLGLVGRTLLLAVGTGVGACVLDRATPGEAGAPLRVDGDSPGHFGQLDVRLGEHPPIGPDGGAGGLEAYLGTRPLRRRPPETLGADHDAVRALARAVRIGHALYRPHHVVIAGGVGLRLAHLHDDLRRLIDTDLTQIARRGWGLHFGTDDFHAARGAARLALAAVNR